MLSLKTELGLSPSLQEVVVSITTMGGMISAFLGGPMADRFGRKRTLMLSSTLTTVGVVWCAASFSIPSIVIARFVVGLGIGTKSVVVVEPRGREEWSED